MRVSAHVMRGSNRGGIPGCHVFRFQRKKDYWHKQRLLRAICELLRPGRNDHRQPAARVAAVPSCPRDYMMMDDIWLSYVVGHHLNAPIVRSGADVAMSNSPAIPGIGSATRRS